jgi:glycine dehydrogenase
LAVFAGSGAVHAAVVDAKAPSDPARSRRTVAYLAHPVFNRYHSETEMLRYLRSSPTRTWRSTAR